MVDMSNEDIPTTSPNAAVQRTFQLARERFMAEMPETTGYLAEFELLVAFPIFHGEERYGAMLAVTVFDPTTVAETDGRYGLFIEGRPSDGDIVLDELRPGHRHDVPADAVPHAISSAGWSHA